MKRALALITLLGLALGVGLLHITRPDPVPTWQQDVVTVDWLLAADLAQQWEPPFQVVEVKPGKKADITLEPLTLAGMTGGEAKREIDGDRIVSCHITMDTDRGVDFTAITHELGHCFGLHHSNDDSKSLMYWIQGGDLGSAEVTPADRARLHDLYRKD